MLLGAMACFLFMASTFRASRHLAAGLALAGLVGAAVVQVASADWGYSIPEVAAVNAPLTPDALAQYVRLIALGGGAVLVLFAWYQVPDRYAAEFHACLLLIVAGVSLTGAANDLIVLFLALELVSIPT